MLPGRLPLGTSQSEETLGQTQNPLEVPHIPFRASFKMLKGRAILWLSWLTCHFIVSRETRTPMKGQTSVLVQTFIREGHLPHGTAERDLEVWFSGLQVFYGSGEDLGLCPLRLFWECWQSS
ncbi:hypothetical protein ATANTOWER_024121 [Ataeniobius toweri]|uniref:Uncharacterized protein n=1 Tax=Ataeniobius toweri TaxID=208326 RepID=A0ABU7CIV5_9TELE|nr:hypothetical protein [Ataeniobius toweri]